MLALVYNLIGKTLLGTLLPLGVTTSEGVLGECIPYNVIYKRLSHDVVLCQDHLRMNGIS
jgi:hypothetical protein